jgi:hypothetical protein
LASVFYVPNQVVPRIGAQLPYSNALSTVAVQQKHQNRNANLKKRTTRDQVKGSNSIFKLGLVEEGFIYSAKQKSS